MKVQHLRYLVAVVNAGAMTTAAGVLHISQPAISAGIKALEEELGGPLFERSRKRLSLTPDGARFYRHAIAILQECNAAAVEFSRRKQPQRLRLGVLASAVGLDLGEALLRLQRDRPDIKVELREMTAADLARGLSQDKLDIAITSLDGAEEGARERLLRREPFVAFVHPGHRFARMDSISTVDMNGEPFIVRLQCEHRNVARSRLLAAGIALNVVARVEQDHLALQLVGKGIGMTLAPRSLGEASNIAVPVRDLQLTRTLGLRWRKGLDQDLLDGVTRTLTTNARTV
jgi:DNA-binding transcriptional LysR family regulator